MTNKPDNKILERIRALLAMGGDVSSENEAAIALKRARSLMDKHQVSIADIENIDSNTFASSEHATNSAEQKVWISDIAVKVAKLNDCIVRLKKDSDDANEGVVYLFQGFASDTKVCDFMLSYLIDTCNRLYNHDKAQGKTLASGKEVHLDGDANKDTYLLGLARGISGRIDRIIAGRSNTSASDLKSLVVVKKAMVEQEFGIVVHKKAELDKYNVDTYIAGILAAKHVHLGGFVGDKDDKQLIA